MTDALVRFVEQELDVAVPDAVATGAARLATDLSGVAVLYYGSTLRTGDLDGLLDFYVLTDGAVGTAVRRFWLRWLWPDVSYHELAVGGAVIRAKVATLPIATFERAALGASLDTTIWTRFVQPAALVWRADAGTGVRVARSVAAAAATAARFAAVVGPVEGPPGAYWRALFRETYRAELRVEPPGREATILQHSPGRYDQLLPIAWAAGRVAFAARGATVAPQLGFDACRDLAQAWLQRVTAGKALNIARLVKASFTFDGAARYGAWKVSRHTGLQVTLTPWRERHPVLAGFGVLWQVMRRRSA